MGDKDIPKRKIKSKLLISFIGIVMLMLLVNVSLILIQLKFIREYEEITDNMILEKKISKTVQEFIEAYNDLSKNVESEARNSEYARVHKEIDSIFLRLDATIINEESRIIYRGLKNIVFNIVKDSDRGIEDIRKGDITTYSLYYGEASRKSYYVEENTARLISREVDFLEELHEDIRKTHRLSLILGISLLVFITICCIVFSFVFSKKLTSPIIKLSRLAEEIAGGNLDVEVDQNLLKEGDEIGSLSNSFNIMLKKLREEINSQKVINSDLNTAKSKIEQKNEELEKFNKIAVGRELKMIELKNRVKELEGKLGETPNE